jgi:uncharacterized membrane protein YphA (DoxX/SURF4 family)
MDEVRRGAVVAQPGVALAGRWLFALIFFLSGITHFTDLHTYEAMIPTALPFRAFLVMISGVVELTGAMMIAFDWNARLGAWLIVLFLVPVTITVHGSELLAATDPVMQRIQTSFFLKGITMTGAALLITQLGVGGRRGG